jgi:peptide/nickel transport system substrate-binding protein
MNEQELRELIAAVKAGRVSRRAFARTMGGLGLTAPFVSQLVAHAGLAQSAAPIEYKPTRAGGGGALRTLFWQAPTLLNPPFRGGSERRRRGEDFLRAAGGLGSQRERRPLENGGVAADGMSVTWSVKTGVQWHDGQPFSADDVVFNWEYASDPATAATTIGSYQDMEIEKIDSFTVRVHFAKPTPFWAGRANGLIIPKHLFEPYKGANSREAPANLNRWGPALIGSSTSSPAIWSKASAIPATTCPTGRIPTRSS